MTEKNKKAPPPAESFKPKDYQEMRSFLNEMQDALTEELENALNLEEWDEAFSGIKATGEIPEKYKNRITVQELKVRPGKPVLDDAGNPVKNDDGTIKLEPDMSKPEETRVHYNDSAVIKLRKDLARIGKQHDKLILKLAGHRNVIDAMIKAQEILETPEAVKMLEKADEVTHLAPIDWMPSSEIVLFLLRVLNLKDADQIPIENPHTNEKINFSEYKGFTYIRKAKNSTLEVKIKHIDEILKHKTLIKSLFLFVLQKANQQGYPGAVEISLNEMVDLGMYSTTWKAKEKLIEFLELQRYIGIKGKVKINKKTISSVKQIPKTTKSEATATDAETPEELEKGCNIFGVYGCNKNYMFIEMNVNFNTDFLSTYLTFFHRNGHLLNGNAQVLYFYICFLARQNDIKIKNGGTFTISINSVRIFLNLPSITDIQEDYKKHKEDHKKGKVGKYNGDYKRHIIKPIDDAIKKIEKVISLTPEAQNLGFTITPITKYYDTGNVYDFVNGKLEIGMAGEYAKPFIQFAEKKEKKKRQRERALERAKAKMIAEKELKSQQTTAKKSDPKNKKFQP